MMKRLITAGLIVGALLAPIMDVAHADSTGIPGQPSQSCQSFFGNSGPFTPAGFNTAGFIHATTVYAGAQPRNSVNPMSVSQYDVACFQAASH